MLRVFLFILLTTSLFAREYIAIIDFEGIGVPEGEARALTQRLTSEIIAIGEYQIVERSEMKRLLDEQKFQYSGCIDISCAVDIGKLIGAKYMVVGSVSKIGSAYSIDSRMISVETGESYVSAKYSVHGSIEILLFEGMTSIAYQLCELPTPSKVKLDVSTKPAGAKTYIDEEYIGLSPISKTLKSGNYSLTISKQGYVSIKYDVELLEDDMAIKLDLNRVPGYVHASFTPPNTVLTLDGKQIDNNSTVKLGTGKHNLDAKLKNYYQVRKSFSISSNDTTYMKHTLQYGLDDYRKRQKNKKKGFYGAAISSGLTVVSYLVSNMFYEKYLDAQNTQDATDFRKQMEMYDSITSVTAIISAGAWGYTLYNYASEKSLYKKLGLDD